MGLWVDDIMIIASPNLLEDIKRTLKNEFKMTDQGEVSYILGITITQNRSKRQIYLQQAHYIKTLLECFHMENSKPVSTPFKPSIQLFKPSNENEIDLNVPYHQAVSTLMYLMLAS